MFHGEGGAINTKTERHLSPCSSFIVGAENEARTRDPQLGKLMLYQLSYFRMLPPRVAVPRLRYHSHKSPLGLWKQRYNKFRNRRTQSPFRKLGSPMRRVTLCRGARPYVTTKGYRLGVVSLCGVSSLLFKAEGSAIGGRTASVRASIRRLRGCLQLR